LTLDCVEAREARAPDEYLFEAKAIAWFTIILRVVIASA
jgi:hypothetical protein